MTSAARTSARTLARRVVAILAGYYAHRWLLLWFGLFDGPSHVMPIALWPMLVPCAVAALLAGYLSTLVAGGSTRTARLLGLALAIVAVLSALQRLEQGLPPLSRHVALVVTAPFCSVGGWFAGRHQARLARRHD